jgi:MFS family permease
MARKSSVFSNLSKHFKLKVDKRSFALIFISVVGYLVWLNAFPLYGPIAVALFEGFKALYIERGRFMLLFLASMTVSSLAAGYYIDKVKKRVIIICIATIIASILTFAVLWLNQLSDLFVVAPLLGLIAGVSPPAWGAYFADNTLPEDRGRIMGLSISLSIPIAYLFSITEPFTLGGTADQKLIIIGFSLLIPLLTLVLRSKEKSEETRSSRRRRGPPPKQLMLYAIPLFLFYVVAGILLSIFFPFVQENVGTEVFYLSWALPFAFGAILSGILLDSSGRKFPTIIGLAITGVSLAIFATSIYILPGTWVQIGWVWIIPLAVGYAFVTNSSFVIWADLAPAQSRGRYYGAGIALMASALLLGQFITGTAFGNVSASTINQYTLFSSVALFLGIPPLIVAEEALPKEVIERRQMEEYLSDVQKKFG